MKISLRSTSTALRQRWQQLIARNRMATYIGAGALAVILVVVAVLLLSPYFEKEENPERMFRAAVELYDEHQYQAAGELFAAYAQDEVHPYSSWHGFVRAGDAWYRAGSYELAINAYESALALEVEIEPIESAMVYGNLGMVAHEAGSINQAIEYYRLEITYIEQQIEVLDDEEQKELLAQQRQQREELLEQIERDQFIKLTTEYSPVLESDIDEFSAAELVDYIAAYRVIVAAMDRFADDLQDSDLVAYRATLERLEAAGSAD